VAQRTKITGDPVLAFIYNVSQHVGPGQPNLADDVELVQFLLAAATQKASAAFHFRIRFPAPPINGSFDLVTGFWIYELQYYMGLRGLATIDGVVSPAREGSGSYGGGKLWTIVGLNRSLKVNTPEIFNTLPDNPNLSARLRKAISPTAKRA